MDVEPVVAGTSATRPRGRSGPRSRRLSEVLWGVEWGDYLPWQVPGQPVRIEHSTFERSVPFIRAHYQEIFQEKPGSPFSTATLNPAKARYYEEAGDFFEIKEGRETVGLLVYTPVDWSTYYLRSVALLPAYQGRGVVPYACTRMFDILKGAGVERVEAETSPSNRSMAKMLIRLGFNVTGTTLSERWGALAKFTRFLDEGNEGVFLNQFCAGVRYQ